MAGDACNLDAGGVRKRMILGVSLLALGLALSVLHIAGGYGMVTRVAVAFACFFIGSLSLFQARAKT